MNNTFQQIFHRQKDINLKYVCEKILNIISHQENVN